MTRRQKRRHCKNQPDKYHLDNSTPVDDELAFREIEKLMRHDAYTRDRGRVRQSSHE